MVVITRDDKLLIARAAAIDAYAHVEHALATLFAPLLGTTSDRAGLVFYRITNTHARNNIFDSLLEKSHGDKFKTYWHGTKKGEGGLFTLIRQLDQRRNELVHWTITLEIHTGETSTEWREVLQPPSAWNRHTLSPKITVKDLRDFFQKADFVNRSISMFYALMYLPGVAPGSWPEIFAQPVTYPPPETHPLFPNYKGLETPPETWPG